MTKFNTKSILYAIFLLTVSLIGIAKVHGQQTTEQFVPIGQSPGVSDTYSYIGNIIAVDVNAHTITVQSNRGTKKIKVLNTTRIWLDRSGSKRTNITAGYSDCRVGRKVEVMYDRDDHASADWIKIEEA